MLKDSVTVIIYFIHSFITQINQDVQIHYCHNWMLLHTDNASKTAYFVFLYHGYQMHSGKLVNINQFDHKNMPLKAWTTPNGLQTNCQNYLGRWSRRTIWRRDNLWGRSTRGPHRLLWCSAFCWGCRFIRFTRWWSTLKLFFSTLCTCN